MYPYVLFLLLAEVPPGALLLESCEEPERVVATVTDVQVRSSLAGGAQACYAVTAMVDGKAVRGYVLGESLPAIDAFNRDRPAPPPPPPPPVEAPKEVTSTPQAASKEAPKPQPPAGPVFPDFNAADVRGRAVSLHAMKGKAVLICFWSPTHDNSQRELAVVARLQAQFRKQGVDAVSVSLSSNLKSVRDVIMETDLTLPVILNDSGIPGRMGVAYESLPRTYLLNERHEIVSAGLHGNALEAGIKKLLSPQ